MRRAALHAAEEGPVLVVTDRHLDAAIHELIVQDGDLTRSLLGFQPRIGFRAEGAAAVTARLEDRWTRNR
jgi:hypothetical protein